ncbi:MAG: cytochrome c oxidase assembly protein [Thermomicrobiales bacterium]|nr:cytochrome c oxidase assembly protein [Thermomicrobiales bacterium]
MAAAVLGLGVIALAVSPVVDEVADRSFSAHMLQHALLIYLAAPLLALAWPLVASRWPALARWRGTSLLMNPISAVVISTVALWLWHLPALYDFALEHEPVHILEHLAFIATFTLYWAVLVDGGVSPKLASNEARALYLIAGAILTAPLGAILLFANQVIYSHYVDLLPPGGRTPLEDQQIGGAIMLFSGPLVYGLAAVLAMRRE